MNRQNSLTLPDKPWAASSEDLLKALQSDHDQGLTDAEVEKRREKFGPNQHKQHKKKSLWHFLLIRFKA